MLSEINIAVHEADDVALRKICRSGMLWGGISANPISLKRSISELKRTADNLQCTCNLMPLFSQVAGEKVRLFSRNLNDVN